MKKKIKSKALLSLGVITTLATAGTVVLSCGSSKPSVNPDQQKLDGITTHLIKEAITAFLAPSASNVTPDAPANNKFIVSINQLNDVSIHISNWEKNNPIGSVSFKIESLDYRTAHVDGGKFATIAITGYQCLATFNKKLGITSNNVLCTLHTTDSTHGDKYFVGASNALWVSSNGGNDFTQVTSTPTGSTWGIDAIFQSTTGISNGWIYLGTNNNRGLWVSKDGGTTFTQVQDSQGIVNSWNIKSIFQASNMIFIGTVSNGLWSSHDGGTTFSQVTSTVLTTSMTIWSIYQVKDAKIFLGTDKGLLMCTDGVTFNQVSGGIQNIWTIPTIYQTSNENIFVGTIGRGLWVSSDDGVNFKQVNNKGGLWADDWNIQSIWQTSKGYIFIGTYVHGLWLSIDNGNTFRQVVVGNYAADGTINLIYQAPGDKDGLYVGTYSNGLYLTIEYN